MSILLLREYDAAVAARFAPATITTPDGKRSYAVTVPDIAAPVPLGVGMPAEWFATLSLPYISIVRGIETFAPHRFRPGDLAQQPNAADSTKVDVLRAAPIPVSIPYTVELYAATMADLNALSLYLLTAALPLIGYGTLVTVLGNDYPFMGNGSRDKTAYATTDGRVFCHAYSYVVDGWLYTLDADTYARVATIDLSIETHRDATDIGATPPPDPAVADEITDIVIA